MIEPPDISDAADLLHVLGHHLRLKLLMALLEGELGVGALEARTGIGQPLLSQQLAILRKAQAVETRRVGKQIFYRIGGARLGQVAQLVCRFAQSSKPAEPSQHQYAPELGGSAAMFARIG